MPTDTLTLDDLTYIISEYTTTWKAAGKWRSPNLQDSVSFMVTESAEALDAVLREKNYVRNNEADDAHGIGPELADVLMMLLISASLAFVDLESELNAKLNKMNQERVGK